MSEEVILTLSNGKSYKILTETNLEGKKYSFAAILNEDESETEEYCFFEHIFYEDKERIKLIEDKNIQEQLLVLFSAKYCEYAELLGGTN